MTVTNDELANETTFNESFMSREEDTSTLGQVDLSNADAASGAAIENIQRELNGIASFTGRTLEGAKDETPTWTNNDVGTSGDDLKERADAITERFNETSGHSHDGTAGEGPQIDVADLTNIRLRGYFVRATDLSAVTGTSKDVSTQMSGKTASSGDTVKGVVVSGSNHVILRDDTAATEGDSLRDADGDLVYGRITESAGTWTLSFYVNKAGVQTAHDFTSSTNIQWYFQELYDPLTDAPIYSELAVLPSDNVTQDVIDASATARGLVNTSAQSFAGAKTFTDTTASTTKDTGAVIIEGGMGVEGAVNAGGAIAGSNLSGTNTGDVTLAAVGSTPGANGASLSGQQLTLQPASDTHPGVVTTDAQTLAGAKTFNGKIIAAAQVATNREDVASTATITALSSSKSFVKITGTTETTIQGITAGSDGQIIAIHNGTNQNLIIAHENAGASAANRIKLAGAADLEVVADSSVELIYDTNQSRWVIKSGSGAGGGGGGAFVVTGTRAAPTAIAAGTGVEYVHDDDSPRQLWFVEGDGGAIDVSQNPQIVAGTTAGFELILIGRSNTNTIFLEDGTGLSLNGSCLLAENSVLGLLWDGSAWVEMFRRT